MTALIWLAIPPETHSALLSAGPGAGPLSTAAESWRSLAATYSDTADELEACLATARTQWQGRSSERYVAAHQPFVAWLRATNAAAGTVAARHDAVAHAYRSALAAMPTPAELATNHALHAVLVATNFFGVNTIPIAVNENDYWRMWIQAAAVMSIYQTVAEASRVTVPNAPAPKILTTGTTRQAAEASAQPGWVSQLVMQLEQMLTDLRDCLSSLGPLWDVLTPLIDVVANVATQVINFAVSVVTGYPITVYGPLVASLASGLGQLGLLAIQPPPVAEAAAGRVPAPGVADRLPPLAATPNATTSVGAVPSASSAPGGATPPPPPSSIVANAVTLPGGPYLVEGPDAGGFTPTTGVPVASNREPRSEGGAASAAAAVAAHRPAAMTRARRRRRKYRDERIEGGSRMTLPDADDTSPAVTGSDRGAGSLGVTAASADGARGLTRLAEGAFDDRVQAPMLPRSWSPDDDAAADGS